MEPHKFDKQIQETLENRRLQPSNDAWEKLSNKLDSQNKKQNHKAFWYLGVAASIVGLLFFAVQLYSSKPIKPVIVDTPITKPTDNTKMSKEIIETSKTILVEKPIKQIELLKPNSKVIENKNIAITEPVISNKTRQSTLTSENEKILTFEEQKIQDVVAKVQDLKSQNQDVSDAVINALLLEAQKEIRLQKMYNSNTSLVNADMLLEEVETDLDQSFRSKVFDAIKASFGTVKTAVAKRND